MKFFKLVIVLFIFLLVGGCVSEVYDDKVEMVSTDDYINYYSSDNSEILNGNVFVHSYNYSKFLGVKYKEHSNYGSGFIYDSDDKYYYLLTNNHVVEYDYSYDYHKVIIEDYFRNEYEAEIVYKDDSYDLAVLRINRVVDLRVLELSDEVINVNDSVKSMGNPNTVKNVISEGSVRCFSKVNVNNEYSKVNFEVIVHSAKIMKGSSGSALLNEDDEVIGITFAGVFDSDEAFVTGYAIPINKIREFLNS